MRMPRRLLTALLCLALLAAAGCAPGASQTAPTPSAWVLGTPRATPTPQATPTPAPTPSPSATTADTAAPSAPLSDDEALVGSYTGQLLDSAAKDFVMTDLNGKSWKLSDLKGKVVLLNFWATWCGPCLAEMPGFQRLYERFGDDGEVQVLAVASTALEGLSEQESRDAVEASIQQLKYTFPVPFDSDGSVWQSYYQQGIPANYILDKQGRLRLLQMGAFPNEDAMMAALEAVRRLDEQ